MVLVHDNAALHMQKIVFICSYVQVFVAFEAFVAIALILLKLLDKLFYVYSMYKNTCITAIPW